MSFPIQLLIIHSKLNSLHILTPKNLFIHYSRSYP